MAAQTAKTGAEVIQCVFRASILVSVAKQQGTRSVRSPTYNPTVPHRPTDTIKSTPQLGEFISYKFISKIRIIYY